MDKDKLIQQLKEQNKLLRKECQAAQEMHDAFQEWANDGGRTKYNKYERRRELWLAAQAARLETEPPF